MTNSVERDGRTAGGGGGSWGDEEGTKNAYDGGCFCGYEDCLVEKVALVIQTDAIKMVAVF